MENSDLTGSILKCCFEVSSELGAGFLESVYERALIVALTQAGHSVTSQTPLKVKFRNVVVGDFFADLIVDEKVLIELKTVSRILPEHKAQVINYLNATGLQIGLLINLADPKVEYHRLYPSNNPAHPVHPVQIS